MECKCKNCTKRSIHPNCHDTCEWYLEYCAKNKEKRKAREEYYKWENDLKSCVNTHKPKKQRGK